MFVTGNIVREHSPPGFGFNVDYIHENAAAGTEHAKRFFDVLPTIHFVQVHQHVREVHNIERTAFEFGEADIAESNQADVATPF
jgi:hypothetical protein